MHCLDRISRRNLFSYWMVWGNLNTDEFDCLSVLSSPCKVLSIWYFAAAWRSICIFCSAFIDTHCSSLYGLSQRHAFLFSVYLEFVFIIVQICPFIGLLLLFSGAFLPESLQNVAWPTLSFSIIILYHYTVLQMIGFVSSSFSFIFSFSFSSFISL